MGSSVLYMSMSLDGFITGPNVRPDNALGDEGQHLHDWAFPGAKGGNFEAAEARLAGADRVIWDEMMSTGAVVAGRNTFEPAGGWNGDHHDGVEIYIVSRKPAPDWVTRWPRVHYVDDLGYAHELNGGLVPEGLEDRARLAEANCPEHAITISETP